MSDPVAPREASSVSPRRALICGIGGQDGAYLAALLLDKGYAVTGTSRDATVMQRRGLAALGIAERCEVVSMAPSDFRSVLQTIVDLTVEEFEVQPLRRPRWLDEVGA